MNDLCCSGTDVSIGQHKVLNRQNRKLASCRKCCRSPESSQHIVIFLKFLTTLARYSADKINLYKKNGIYLYNLTSITFQNLKRELKNLNSVVVRLFVGCSSKLPICLKMFSTLCDDVIRWLP